MEKLINKKLLRWYSNNYRKLPWRKSYKKNLPNPYFIFVSEYMLQQTTVPTVIKRFEEFIKKWPTLKKLSNISESSILSFWSGLGYYSRAKNLLKAAKLIKKNYNYQIPTNLENLLSLPGVGDYTAKAILGIAFNKSVMPIDANIERIISRIYAFQSAPSENKKKIIDKSVLFISKKSSTKLIQAFMDYGSIICIPRKPKCNECVIQIYCQSHAKNLQNSIPIKKKTRTKKLKKFSRAYIFSNEKNEILIRKRPSKGMLASMLEVPNDAWVKNKKDLVHDKLVLNIKGKLEQKGLIEYSFSHFDLETEVFFLKVKKIHFNNYKWIKKNNVNKIGLPTIMKKIIGLAY